MTLRTFAKLHIILRTVFRYKERKQSSIEVNYGASQVGLHKSQLLTVTERTSRFEIVYRLHAKKASETAQAIFRVSKNLPKKMVKSITDDRGKEFHRWIEVEKGLGVPFYFSDSGVPGQRDTNENSTGRIRRPYPKGTNFSRMLQKEIMDFLLVFNQVPRKVLNYNTPFEVFMSFFCRVRLELTIYKGKKKKLNIVNKMIHFRHQKSHYLDSSDFLKYP